MPLKKLLILLLWLYAANCLTAQESYGKRYLRQVAEATTPTRYDSLMAKGATLSTSDTTKALQFFTDALDMAVQAGDLKKRVWTNIAIGEMYLEKTSVRKAYSYFFKARNLMGEILPNLEGAAASFGIARTQFIGGNYRTATLNFLATIYTAQQTHDKVLESEATEYLGQIYSSFQNYAESIGYYRKTFDLKKSLDDDKSCLRIAEKLGDIYYFNRRFDSAYYYAHTAVQLAETLDLPADIALTRLNKAAILIRLKKPSAAFDELRYFTVKVFNKNDARLETRYRTVQGNYWLQKGDRKTAAMQYDSAISLAQQQDLPELYSLVYRNMAESFYDLQDYKTAFDYQQKYTSHIRQLNTGGAALNMESVQKVFDVNASKDEIRFLNNENKLKDLELATEAAARRSLETENRLKDSIILRGTELKEAQSRETELQKARLQDERRLRLSLWFGLMTVLGLGALAYFQYRKQKRKNAIIEKQAQELETLMKEIHHRVKNNLQVISSLLDLQSLTIKDKKAAAAVKEGKNRVQSMALIHQNLYNEGNIKGIQMEGYIPNLAKSLFHSYNIQPEKIKLITDIDPLSLDVDTVISIGLILNELISNSLKYAFGQQDLGEIKVSLKQEGTDLRLKVRDNGAGFTEGYENQGNSFGFKIIRAFAQKLKAKLSVSNDGGACVEMRITKYKTAA